MSIMERSQVGSPVNFRGLIYSPINEQGVVYLFGLISEDLNIRVESIQQGYPDCTGIRYLGKGKWERIRIEFEYKSSNFDHDPKGCDVIVCWEDNLAGKNRKELEGIEIIELKSMISTPQIPNKELRDPETVTKEEEFDLEYHYKRKNVNENIRKLFELMDKKIKEINNEIWDKYSKTAITYYCPEKMFVFAKFRKSKTVLHIFTNQQNIPDVKNMEGHENWGEIKLESEKDFDKVINAIKSSYEIMKKAVKENINTGWYALTPKDHIEDEEELEEA